MVVSGQRHAPAALRPAMTRCLIVQEVGWAPGPVWTSVENIGPPTGIRSPDPSARSESLYRLSYRPTRNDYTQLYVRIKI